MNFTFLKLFKVKSIFWTYWWVFKFLRISSKNLKNWDDELFILRPYIIIDKEDELLVVKNSPLICSDYSWCINIVLTIWSWWIGNFNSNSYLFYLFHSNFSSCKFYYNFIPFLIRRTFYEIILKSNNSIILLRIQSFLSLIQLVLHLIKIVLINMNFMSMFLNFSFSWSFCIEWVDNKINVTTDLIRKHQT